MKAAAIQVITTLRHAGYEALLVGGCVRDLVMGREPSDYDVATNAIPERVLEIFPRAIGVGAQFGVVLVPVTDPASDEHVTQIEVATFRNDGAYSDGRHPDSVRFSESAEDDVQRRDFTINGLLMDPLASGAPVIDYVGGQADIAAKVVRTIGDPHRRFTEDKLRLLRAIRFAARFGFDIEAQTFTAIRELAPTIHQVSKERVRDEVIKMLTEGSARRAFELMDASGLLEHVLPEVSRMKGVQQPPEFHPEGDVFTHTMMMIEGLPAGCSPTLAFGVLLHDVGKPATFRVAPDRIRFDGHVEVGVAITRDICQRFRMSNDDTAQIIALVENHMKFAAVHQMRQSTLKRFLRMERFEEHLALHRLDAANSNRNFDFYDFAKENFETLSNEQIRPKPLVNGNDLIAIGLKPGPQFREILQAVEDAQLEGRLSDKDAAISFIHNELGVKRQ